MRAGGRDPDAMRKERAARSQLCGHPAHPCPVPEQGGKTRPTTTISQGVCECGHRAVVHSASERVTETLDKLSFLHFLFLHFQLFCNQIKFICKKSPKILNEWNILCS